MKASRKILTAVLALVPLLILFTHEGCLKGGPPPFSIELEKNEELSDYMAFYDTIKLFRGEELVWEKGELESAVEFMEPEECAGAQEISIRGHEDPSVRACDIDGEGHPELVVQTYSGGAHCCFEYYILRLGDAVEEVIHIRGGNAMINFIDLNEDGVLEIETRDDTFAYWHNSYADSPKAPILLEYEGGEYVLANRKYSEFLLKDMQRLEERLQEIKGGIPVEEEGFLWDFESRIPALLLGIMLDNIYTGRADRALTLFAEYPMGKEDRELFVEDFLQTLLESRYWPLLLRMEPRLSDLPGEMRDINNRDD